MTTGRFAPKRRHEFRRSSPAWRDLAALFFDVVRDGFVFGLLFPIILVLIFKIDLGEDRDEYAIFWPWLVAATGNKVLLGGGVRLLRTLPLSTGRVALILVLMPLCSIMAISAALGMIQCVSPGRFFDHHWLSFVIPCAGAVCIASSLQVYFGKNGFPISMFLAILASVVISETVSNVKWPVAFWWGLGLCLIAAAFFLNRNWLRCSASYRPSTGDFLGRQR